MAEHPCEITLPNGLDVSLPTVHTGDPVPSVHFNQLQAFDFLGSMISRTFAIGDALALANSRGRNEIVGYLKVPACRFIQSIHVLEIQTNTPDQPQTLQYFLVLLPLGIRTPIYVLKAGRVIAARLEDAYIQNQRIVLQYKADISEKTESVELIDIQHLLLRNEANVLFKTKFVQGLPVHWVWDWTRIGSQKD